MQQPSYVHGASEAPLIGKTIGAYLCECGDDKALGFLDNRSCAITRKTRLGAYRLAGKMAKAAKRGYRGAGNLDFMACAADARIVRRKVK